MNKRFIDTLMVPACQPKDRGIHLGYLKTFLYDGSVPMDNSATERAIRPFTIGRKNWQMIDTVHGAQASAVIYSLVETTKANGLKVYDCL